LRRKKELCITSHWWYFP